MLYLIVNRRVKFFLWSLFEFKLDKRICDILNSKRGPSFVPGMANIEQNAHKLLNEELVKFVVPKTLKNDLLELASERNISVSSLLRLITTDYIKRNKTS
jgi:hypothetical protein